MAEFKFSVYVYPLDAAAAETLRAQIEAVVLPVVEASGCFMGPVEAEVAVLSERLEAGDGQEADSGSVSDRA